MTDAATRAQIDAARPTRSTWLSANAGSGKTRVLTDRVALLLLRGVRPQRILCLTYTKAAASEMQNRLFKRLGAWAMMPNKDLTQSLTALGVDPGNVNSQKLRDARQLFAKAIETPGGLKIQTIHSFCAALLRRFPLEADVSPAFIEMDDRSARQLRTDVLDQMAKDAPQELAGLAQHFTEQDPEGLLAEISKHAERFERSVSYGEIADLLSLPKQLTASDILADVFQGDETDLFQKMIPVLQESGTMDQRLALRLGSIDLDAPSLSLLAELEQFLLFGRTAKTPFQPNNSPSKPAKASLGAIADEFEAFKERVAVARPLRLAFQNTRRSFALHQFAHRFIETYERAKQQRGWLDFDDLIRRARKLLTDPSVADWVLFRLDGGIDHILVDEAQDTSPEQWDVVRLLAQEFTSGIGSRANEQRTLFVVGDKKQSIYSFQGADPAKFDAMCDYFEAKFNSVASPFARRELLFSFRSAKPVLDLVDTVFTQDLRRGMGEKLEHKAFKDTLPGRVDLWDWIEGSDKEEEKDWFDPVDTIGASHHSVVLAEQIAGFILHQLSHGQITQIIREDGVDHHQTRPLTPRDFLILVESRTGQGRLFHEIIRACKTLGLPMAGADRLRVGGELGVRDLVSLLSFLETPQDDLSLAEVMRSPLGNLTEQDLYDLAQGREGKLWPELEARQSDFPDIFNMLRDLRGQAEFLRPFELLERALTFHHGRDRLLARLGVEAEEGISALLDQALQYELTEPPTLTGFLTWLVTDDITIKRQMDSEGDLIRVMTIHGAKGLEAPIVIVPQTGAHKNNVRDEILNADGTAIWKANAAAATDLQTSLTDTKKDLQTQERMRLLYVALTRAESWLVICGSGDAPSKGDTWYEIVEAGMARAGGVAGEGHVRLRMSHHDWPEETAPRGIDHQPAEVAALPEWVGVPAQATTLRSVVLSPSDLGGAKVLPGSKEVVTEIDAKARGTIIHELLQHLIEFSKDERPQVAERLLKGQPDDLKAGILAHASRVLDADDLQFLFSGNALAEVGITATLPELAETRISGAIDRLIVEPDRVLAVDFKSNQLVPKTAAETPEGVLRQMGAYAAALAQIYPDRRIETAIVWTETAEFMSLPHDIVRDALFRAHIS